jgi:hypothetical protein
MCWPEKFLAYSSIDKAPPINVKAALIYKPDLPPLPLVELEMTSLNLGVANSKLNLEVSSY